MKFVTMTSSESTVIHRRRPCDKYVPIDDQERSVGLGAIKYGESRSAHQVDGQRQSCS